MTHVVGRFQLTKKISLMRAIESVAIQIFPDVQFEVGALSWIRIGTQISGRVF
jgi:hypothetical protein